MLSTQREPTVSNLIRYAVFPVAGKGTRFLVRLPLAARPSVPLAEA